MVDDALVVIELLSTKEPIDGFEVGLESLDAHENRLSARGVSNIRSKPHSSLNDWAYAL